MYTVDIMRHRIAFWPKKMYSRKRLAQTMQQLTHTEVREAMVRWIDEDVMPHTRAVCMAWLDEDVMP